MIRSWRFSSFLRFWRSLRIFTSSWERHLRDNTCSSPIEIGWYNIVILRSWNLNMFNLSRSCTYWSHSCCKMYFYTSFISDFFFWYCIIVLRTRCRISTEQNLFLFIAKNCRRSISLCWCTSPFCHFPVIIILVWCWYKLIYFCKLPFLIPDSYPWIIF